MGIPCLSRPKEPSLSSLAGALLLLDSWRSPQNSPALPSLASPTSDVGCSKSVCCSESAVKYRGDHESAQTRPCDKFYNKNDWVFVATSVSPVTKKRPTSLAPNFSSFCTFSWNVTVAGAQQHHSRHHSCQWYRPTEEEHGMVSVPPAPVDSEHHLPLWTASLRATIGQKEKNENAKIMLHYKTRRKENILCCWKKQH